MTLKIGFNNYESILAAVSEHKFDKKKFETFARMLGHKVSDNHVGRMKRGRDCDEHEMRLILYDHYCETMRHMTTENAVEVLATLIEDIFDIPDVMTVPQTKASAYSRETSEDPDLRRFMDVYPEMLEVVHNKDPNAPGQRFFTPDTLSHLEAELGPTKQSSSPSNISSDRFSR